MMTNQAEYRVLVIGKAGTGKSALCNTIVGQDKFAVGRSMSTTTTTAQSETTNIRGCRIKVIDTPDITNCGMNPTQRIEEVSKWKYMASDNPSAVLLAVKGDVRYTAEEYSVYSEICSLWGGDVLKKKLLVAFTCGDNLDEKIEKTVKHPPPELGKILRAARKRYIVFTNKASANRQMQAESLVSKLEDMDNTSCPRCVVL